jgi:hypothetical protein
MHGHSIVRVADQGPAVTYTATATTVLFWGLHVSDIAVMISALASLLGVSLQFYIALRRISRLERQSKHIDDESEKQP